MLYRNIAVLTQIQYRNIADLIQVAIFLILHLLLSIQICFVILIGTHRLELWTKFMHCPNSYQKPWTMDYSIL